MKKHYFILALILFLTFIFRFPSLFEPFWYGDEGIFAAVAHSLNMDGTLYQTAWDNKPPMIYLTYAAIFKFFGVSMFWLRMTAAAAVLATACAIYEIGVLVLSPKRALLASLIFGFLASLRIIEGNLALTEIFMILPITLAMLVAIIRKFDYISLFTAGILLAIASLYKQVGALEAAALGIFLFLSTKGIFNFLKKATVLTLGFALPHLVTIAYFLEKNLLPDYIFAAYTYYRIYLGESPKYALLINTLKFTPILAVILYGLEKKIKNTVSLSHLFLLWLAASFLGSYFSGRTYGHYLMQAIPALSLAASSISQKPDLKKVQVAFGIFFFIPLIFLTKLLFSDFLTGGPINQIKYWQNFLEFARGKKSTAEYNNFFDRNVNSIMGLADFLKNKGANGKEVYIWGDYPWLYAISDLKNPSRYVTSFHVFGVPEGKKEIMIDLLRRPPQYIIKPESAIGYFGELEKFLSFGYTKIGKIENSEVFTAKGVL